MAEEMYFLYLDGVQRGPYTVFQIGHMVNSGIVHPDALFWCEGLEQWQPVAQLITPKHEIKRRRWRLGLGLLSGLLFAAIVAAVFWPGIQEVWREQHQVEKSTEAAYWRARGVIRERLGRFQPLWFSDYQPSKVRLDGSSEAAVDLDVQTRAGTSFGSQVIQWTVRVRYDERLKMWVPSEIEPVRR